jgi:protocatechuate 3,4-dioxygenase beta subunit
MPDDSRRRFLENFALFTGGVSLIARRLAAEEPLDTLPDSAWKNARRNGLIMLHRPTPAEMSWRARIASAGEPGEPLVVDGQVFAPNGRSPAPGVTVYAYNTDAQGYYGANHTEYPPRLYGWMKSDSAGRFQLQTIRPGHYPGMHVASHIHFILWGGGYPVQWVNELRFTGDPYLTPEAIKEDEAKGDFQAIQRLIRAFDGVWHCSFKLKLATESTYH